MLHHRKTFIESAAKSLLPNTGPLHNSPTYNGHVKLSNGQAIDRAIDKRMEAINRLQCGTVKSYHMGCRCDACRTAQREYRQSKRTTNKDNNQ